MAKRKSMKELKERIHRTNQLDSPAEKNTLVSQKSNLLEVTSDLRKLPAPDLVKERTSLFHKDNSIPDIIKSNLNAKEIEDLTNLFELFAIDKSGKVCFLDLQKLLTFLNLTVNELELKSTLKDHNYGGSYMDSFDLNAFLVAVITFQNKARNLHNELLLGFQNLDLEHKERITLQNLKYLNRKYNVGFSNTDLQEMLALADKNGDQVVDQDEFLSLMLKTNVFQ